MKWVWLLDWFWKVIKFVRSRVFNANVEKVWGEEVQEITQFEVLEFPLRGHCCYESRGNLDGGSLILSTGVNESHGWVYWAITQTVCILKYLCLRSTYFNVSVSVCPLPQLLEYVGKGKSIMDVGLAQARQPLTTRCHYYELEIVDAGEKCYIALGLARRVSFLRKEKPLTT